MPKTYISQATRRTQSSRAVAEELQIPVSSRTDAKMLIGRREWFSLPDLGVDIVTAKVDTGAYTSSLHAHDIESFEKGGEEWVRFVSYSHHGEAVHCEAPLVQRKKIKSSTGQGRERMIIKTVVRLVGGFEWDVLFSLADRSVMKCPLLIGRRALSGYFVVDTQASHLFGNISSLTGHSHHKRK
ncbi:ATP-dependent zinc protease [Verrucomicrobiaceae bacterium R5-34]|uniref:ATP-dependent zinc protease n=1 Tax=Oceaniferula flava TaxID=2800421 RepID=A0AAE2SFF0_9BACT|nr:RimK/LysX family protein [Oceaniferula flavus]MBK1830649.1 ATP-dependent zinc protease [Verrucomicrobiaceae bacterium R5-34]MBK1855909.1 ATP-dependent zinc protease [Oceaniferula flavus]MBM1137216.1 ATP-dependent zinc protease [Oceaniferula flavus]